MAKKTITKQQHYIPKFYLKNFANEKKRFNIINVKKIDYIEDIPYLSQFKEKYFYDYDNKIENQLNKLETTWSIIINKIISGVFPNNEEKQILKQFALYQRNRTLYRSNELLEISWQSELLKLEMQYKIKLDEERKKELKKLFINNFPYKTIVESLNLIKKNEKIIDDLDVAIIKYNTKLKLISSDNPIVHYNNFDMKSVGYNNAGLIIFFPISSELLCVIYDSKMYPFLNNKTIINNNNEYEVKYLNYYQILNSNTFVFYRDSFLTKIIIKFIEKKSIQKILSLPKLKTDILGDDTQKLLSFHAKYIYLEHNFSFAKLSQNAILVPQNARDWFPRKYDEKFCENNLKNRKNIIPLFQMLNENEKLKKEFKNAIFWNDKEIDIYINFVLNYWK